MKTKRIVKSLTALSLVATLALPMAAHAMSYVTPTRNHLASPSRALYYAAKERQYDRLDSASLRQPAARKSARASASSYAEMKDRQMERILNGE